MTYKLTQNKIEEVFENGARYLFEYFRNSNIHYPVLGISGGLDSGVTLAFANRARELAEAEDYLIVPVGIIMPCESTQESIDLAEEVIEVFNAERLYKDLTSEYKVIKSMMDSDGLNQGIRDILSRTNGSKQLNEWPWFEKIALGNIKARLRMITNYHVARMLNGIVLSTDNLSEFWMAFWTICGDVGDYGVIQNILKGRELYDIAKYVGVPTGVLEAKPDDGLSISGGDEDQLGATYPVLDDIMIDLIQKGFNVDGSFDQLNRMITDDLDQIRKIAHRCLSGAYKRKGPISLTRKQLGLPEIKDLDC